MLTYPDIDPVLFRMGPVQVHWYGVMYLISFVAGWWLSRVRAAQPNWGWKPREIDDLLFYIVLGVVLGGRVGYVLFYGLAQFLDNPLSLFAVWQGGMSFHGGFLGVLLALVLYGRKHQRGFFELTDFIAPIVPIGLGAGRIGNFINGELWGKVSEVPWGMVFPNAGPLPRHPSQLYEALLEGLVLFLILWFYAHKPRPLMAVSGMFLLCYGVFRFGVEFFRLPDEHLGYLAFGWLTMGQVLTAPMIVFGIAFLVYAYRRPGSGEAGSRS